MASAFDQFGTPTAGPAMPQQNPVQSLFSDPKNMATALVFLAALAQGRRPGQSQIGAVGERALGAAAFRGGLNSAERKRKIQDDQLAEQKLQQSKENEFRGRQVAIGEEGLNLQRSNMSQAERLANAQIAANKEIAVAEGPAETNLRNAQADLARRTDPNLRSGSGSDDGVLGGDNLAKLMQAQWAAEVNQAALEGRAPDFTKVANSVSDMVNQLGNMRPGLYYERQADGSVAVAIPRPGAPGMPGTPGGVALPPPPSAVLTPADLNPKPRPKRAPTAAERQAGAQAMEDSKLGSQAAQFKTIADINAYIQKYGSSLSASQLKALASRRRELSAILLEKSGTGERF